ncbi:MAG: 2-amino-4-hydroxy-6-hydroxymethyldihydropteridine diphosphokinase [Gammaproteobacteria bacterium]|nr:2-amino-4-hydroxy-6-hydroxymethyldihydropteridine diphosphokinase [Gammaproteobacteria bacterium]
MVIAYVGLGSNLDRPATQVQEALAELQTLPQSRCLAHSSLYRSKPMVAAGDSAEDQADYINAVAALETALPPAVLLTELQHLEALHQRIRTRRWGPRTLDLDLLLYADWRINTPTLTVPHPGLYERNFVLYPLAEVVDELAAGIATEPTERLQIPGRGTLASLLASCPRNGLEKLNH